MGWRTDAQNLNLNRDYAKLDTREIKAVVNVMNVYAPDLYMDIHVMAQIISTILPWW
jgi:hypothetical protein